MTETSFGDTVAYLSLRLDEAHDHLAQEWLERLTDLLSLERCDVFPSETLLDHIPELIREIAGYLRSPDTQEIAANTGVMAKAAELGKMRFEQSASVHQLMREY